MMKSSGWLTVLGILLVTGTGCGAERAEAQIAPDTPRLINPAGGGGLGIYWLRAETLPDDGDAVLVTLAPGFLPDGVRLRGGAGKGAEGTTAGFGGIDVHIPLDVGSELPVQFAWHTGLGASVGEYSLISLPLGLAAAASWSAGSVWLAPYLSAGATADLRLGDPEEAEEFDVSPAVDAGLDLSLDARRRIVFRATTSLGDRQAFAVGLQIGR